MRAGLHGFATGLRAAQPSPAQVGLGYDVVKLGCEVARLGYEVVKLGFVVLGAAGG